MKKIISNLMENGFIVARIIKELKKIFSSTGIECVAKGVNIGVTDAYREILINDTVEFSNKNL